MMARSFGHWFCLSASILKSWKEIIVWCQGHGILWCLVTLWTRELRVFSPLVADVLLHVGHSDHRFVLLCVSSLCSRRKGSDGVNQREILCILMGLLSLSKRLRGVLFPSTHGTHASMAHTQMTGDITAGVFLLSTARISLCLTAICFPFIIFWRYHFLALWLRLKYVWSERYSELSGHIGPPLLPSSCAAADYKGPCQSFQTVNHILLGSASLFIHLKLKMNIFRFQYVSESVALLIVMVVLTIGAG